MKVLVTHVDKKTGVSCENYPCINGPKLPDLPGLAVLWAKTSEYPTPVPQFMCEVDSGSYSNISGVLAEVEDAVAEELWQTELAARALKQYEVYAIPIRNERDRLLASTDKYMTIDFPISDEKRAEWKTYRQALRDITLQSEFPQDVIWPTKPE